LIGLDPGAMAAGLTIYYYGYYCKIVVALKVPEFKVVLVAKASAICY